MPLDRLQHLHDLRKRQGGEHPQAYVSHIAQEISLDGFMILHAVRGADGAAVDFRWQVEGSGIGLTVVKKIVESRGGSLQLESAVGAGTTFLVTWPKQATAIHDEGANGESIND